MTIILISNGVSAEKNEFFLSPPVLMHDVLICIALRMDVTVLDSGSKIFFV